MRGARQYVDQVPRRLAYEASHLGKVEFYCPGPFWQATIHEDNGMTVITRYTLEELLDKLEEMEGIEGEA